MTATAARPTDLHLLDRVRAGESSVFGELWSRYQGWAHHVARTVTGRYDAEDIVQEAFAKVLTSLRNGNGPRQGFAEYLRTAIRNVAATWGARDSRVKLVPITDDSIAGSYEFDVADLGDCEGPFRSLPERWQRILVLTTLQGRSLQEAARAMGMTDGAAAALAARARKGLREALAETTGGPAEHALAA
ncbi:sigma-70 family RNA polymerase sigma factor [Leifsonia sp. NPDC077715]|uniref:RNA polymerase sigma factor n=1 Tax=Leifsonia sp. NPDC077715 TaxID=3155539 RepID=UPI003432E31E